LGEKHLYLSLIPEALVASMLPPKDFGAYYAVGTQVHVQGEAIFFEVDPRFRSDDFPFQLVDDRCVPGPDGRRKSSVYLSIHEVLSRVPVSALGSLFLVTNDGRTLELKRGAYHPETERRLHLYQEFCPITPMVASWLEPRDFGRFITDTRQTRSTYPASSFPSCLWVSWPPTRRTACPTTSPTRTSGTCATCYWSSPKTAGSPARWC
jgi:hypothetical protein